MWYRRLKEVLAQADAAELDRETLDQTGGVTARQDKEVNPVEPMTSQPPVAADLAETPASEPQEPVEEPATETTDTFTDYTPESSADEQEVHDVQDASRARDLSGVMAGAGVVWPVHDNCRCRVQFRPDHDDQGLFIPVWEVSSSACPACLTAQQAFNHFVESSGIRVEAPEGAFAQVA
ncbi:MAG: hypothetical protein JSS66_04725 [Armatimonadetes bacterium]|nr:hypothetical protein [Armatimonadota bacterium]